MRKTGDALPSVALNLYVRSPPSLAKDGGAEGIRTPDPHNAIVVLYQLSYDPILRKGGERLRQRAVLSKSLAGFLFNGFHGPCSIIWPCGTNA